MQHSMSPSMMHFAFLVLSSFLHQVISINIGVLVSDTTQLDNDDVDALVYSPPSFDRVNISYQYLNCSIQYFREISQQLSGLIEYDCSGNLNEVFFISSLSGLPLISLSTILISLDDLQHHSSVFHIVPSRRHVTVPLVAIMKEFGWSKASIVTSERSEYLERHVYLYGALTTAGIEVTNTIKFNEDKILDQEIEELFNGISHIYILNTNDEAALNFLCQAFLNGIYYQSYTWVTFGVHEDYWWREFSDYFTQMNCTHEPIDTVYSTVLNRALVIFPCPNGDSDTNETTLELNDTNGLFSLRDYFHDTRLVYKEAYEQCVNHSTEDCSKEGSLTSWIHSINTTGVTGNIEFDEFGERVFDSYYLLQYQKEERTENNTIRLKVIGRIEEGVIETFGETESLIWPDGIPPDGTPIEITNVLHPAVVGSMSMLFTVTGVFLFICLLFNILFRKKKIVKLTSPNLNLLLLLGTSFILISAFPYQAATIQPQSYKCAITRVLFSCGWDITLSVSVVKTWRIYYIFNRSKSSVKKTRLHDWKLILVIIGLVAVDSIVSLPLVIVGLTKDEVQRIPEASQPQDTNEQGIRRHYFIIVCHQNDELYLAWAFFIVAYKFALQTVGLVLAFLNRNIEIDALNDSKYSVTITWTNTIIFLFIFFSFRTITDNTDLLAAFTVTISLLAINICLGFTFVPKMRALYKDPNGENVFNTTRNGGKSELHHTSGGGGGAGGGRSYK